MSVSSALSNAISGLTASARSAGVVSANLANVLTDGYATREIDLQARSSGTGGGVAVGDVQRNVDMALLGERRLADGEVSYHSVLAGVTNVIEKAIGPPDDESSLTARLSAMEASLATAAARPDEAVRLRDVLLKANDVATKLNDISGRIQAERTRLDDRIATSVDTVNDILAKTERLNVQIVRSKGLGQPSAGLQDQRQALIDDLSSLVPVRLASRSGGAVAIYTSGGAALLDGKAARLAVEKSNIVAPHMTREADLLSGLSINGVAVETQGARSPISGGELAALFHARDTVAPAAQARLDGVARDLIERFQQDGLDPTRPTGQPGIFTDMNSAFDPSDEVGIAGRIQLNTAVDEAAGGEIWRLRDGLGATAPGAPGDASLLQALSEVMARGSVPGSAALDPSLGSVTTHASAITSVIGQDRLSAEQDLSFANAVQAGLKEAELEQGVDTDEQLQKLLLIEQAYAANARMVQTMEDLIDTLIRI